MKNSILLLLAFCFSVQILKAQFTELSVPFASEGGTDIGYLSVPNSAVIWGSAIAATPSQIFARSADGGQTWKVGKVPTPTADWDIASLIALDANTAWYTFYNDATGTLGAIYKTSDGGLTWVRQGPASMFSDASVSFANWSYFWNENEGLSMGDPTNGYYEIWRTEDGGNNWTRIPQANLPTNIAGEYGLTNGYDAVGDTIWFTTNKGSCVRSTDRGKNWESFPTGHTGFYRIYMRDAWNGLSVRTTGTTASTFRSTTDGGATWSATFNASIKDSNLLIDSKFRMRHADFIPGTQTLVGVGYEVDAQVEVAAVSYDAGLNFKVIGVAPGDFSQVQMLSPTVGYLGGLNAANATDIFRLDENLTDVHEPLDASAPARLLANPAENGQISIQFLENFDGSVALLDLSGRQIRSFSIRKALAGQVEKLAVGEMTPGIYILKMQSPQGIFCLKITNNQ